MALSEYLTRQLKQLCSHGVCALLLRVHESTGHEVDLVVNVAISVHVSRGFSSQSASDTLCPNATSAYATNAYAHVCESVSLCVTIHKRMYVAVCCVLVLIKRTCLPSTPS